MEATEIRKKTFIEEITSIPGGEDINLCIQCGNCTASCPNADKMDHTPAELISLARADEREEVLTSNAPWYCLSCYMCTVRCPRGVKPTNVMHAYEALAMKYGLSSKKSSTPAEYRAFNYFVANFGNVPEFWFMVRYYFSTNPFKALGALPVAWGLLTHGRLSFGAKKISPKALKQVKAMLDKVGAQGGGA